MRTVSRIIMTISLLVFFSGMSMAQLASNATPGNPATKPATVTPGKFIDTNKNGICDNHEAKAAGGQGKNFVDKNGDGKCDNCGTTCKGSGKGQGCGQGCGQGHGKGNGCGKGVQRGNCAGPCGSGKNQPSR